MSTEKLLVSQIRKLIIFIMTVITFSGITAFPLEYEMKWLSEHSSIFPAALSNWVRLIYTGLYETNRAYPFLAYGTDWLAFAHLIIAMLFIGPYRNPVKNSWVIEWAILCCLCCLPVAFIAGHIRQIPFFHQLIDCAFGIFGLIPLFAIRKKITRLQQLHYT